MSEAVATQFVDERGRTQVAHMSDREMLTELVVSVRQLADALEKVGQNPMLRQLAPGIF